MFRYMFLALLLLQIMVPRTLVEASNSSTKVEYKVVNHVPLEYLEKLKPFELVGRKYYFIANEKDNWFQAAQECRKKGGNLINLTTDQERILIGVRLNTTQNYWIDLNRLGQDEYVSIATGLVAVDNIWLKDDVEDMENPHKVNEDLKCVVLVHDYEDGFVVKKTQCLKKASFICQLSSPRTISIVIW